MDFLLIFFLNIVAYFKVPFRSENFPLGPLAVFYIFSASQAREKLFCVPFSFRSFLSAGFQPKQEEARGYGKRCATISTDSNNYELQSYNKEQKYSTKLPPITNLRYVFGRFLCIHWIPKFRIHSSILITYNLIIYFNY